MDLVQTYGHEEFKQHFVLTRKAEPGIPVLFAGVKVAMLFYVSPFSIKITFDSARIRESVLSAIEKTRMTLRQRQLQKYHNGIELYSVTRKGALFDV